MAGSLEDLERRVGVLEARMNGADADRAVIREQLNSLTGGQAAILDILRDHGRMLLGHDARLDLIDAHLAAHDRRFDQVDARFDRVDARFDEHDRRLDRLETRLDAHDVRFDRLDSKLDVIVDWIQRAP